MKKVLIISYYWPPSGGIAVLRSLKVAKYLRDFGWEPIIVVPLGADYPGIDYTNLKDIPKDIEIIKVPIWEPYKIYRKLTNKTDNEIVNNVFYSNSEKTGLAHKFAVWVRSNFFIPDARKFWINPTVKEVSSYLNTSKVDAIFSDGPPHTNTWIAHQLKLKFNIPWLADFQDPWTQVDYYQMLNLTKMADMKHRRMEQSVFKNANAITIVSENWKNDLIDIGAKNVSVAYWGFDPDDFKNIDIPENISPKFRVTHIGILGHDRCPVNLFKILSELVAENEGFADDLSIDLIGQVDMSVKQSLNENMLMNFVYMPGNVDRKEALGYASISNMLLLPINRQKNAAGRVPGKLFEYIALRNPICCISDYLGDSTKIVNSTSNGISVDYNEVKDLKNYILEVYDKYSKKIENKNTFNISQYSVVNSVKHIACRLEEIIT